jgi:phospholipid transport system substrate-binding protein
MIKRILSFAVAAALAGAAAAQGPAQTPDAALKGTTEQIRGMIKEHYAEYRADSGKFYKAVDDVVVPRFDMPYIAKLVLGANYRTATPDQRSRFATAFKDMMVHAYASAMLDNYNSAKITWEPTRMDPGGNDATVNSNLTKDSGQSYAIGFRVHLVDGDWKVYDLVVENVSLVFNFRTQLNAEIRKSGLDDVIARMVKGEFIHDADQQHGK